MFDHSTHLDAAPPPLLAAAAGTSRGLRTATPHAVRKLLAYLDDTRRAWIEAVNVARAAGAVEAEAVALAHVAVGSELIRDARARLAEIERGARP